MCNYQSFFFLNILFANEHVVEGQAVLHNEKGDWDEGDENRLNQEDPFPLDRGRAELADAVRNLVNGRRAKCRQVLGMVD